MPSRTVIDGAGTEWVCISVIPMGTITGPLAASGMSLGWLAARSATERRRITPIPEGWEDWSDEELLRVIVRTPSQPTPRRLLD